MVLYCLGLFEISFLNFQSQPVAQDPTDEPATVLLERIRALREGAIVGRGKKKLTKEL